MTALVHIAGPDIQVGTQLRQRCGWCGAVLIDYALDRIAVPEGQDPRPGTWPVGELIEVDGPVSSIRPHTDGEQLPANACAQIDHDVTGGKLVTATDPGDDPHRRTVEHLGRAWPHLLEDPVYLDQLAHEALSVRWEQAAQLAAENAQLRRRAEHAEGELSSLRDHRTRWETEHAEAERLRAELAHANEAYLATVKAAHEGGAALQRRAERAEAKCELTEEAANRWYAAYGQVEAERDALNATEQRVRAARDDWWKRPGWTEAGDALDAALDGDG